MRPCKAISLQWQSQWKRTLTIIGMITTSPLYGIQVIHLLERRILYMALLRLRLQPSGCIVEVLSPVHICGRKWILYASSVSDERYSQVDHNREKMNETKAAQLTVSMRLIVPALSVSVGLCLAPLVVSRAPLYRDITDLCAWGYWS